MHVTCLDCRVKEGLAGLVWGLVMLSSFALGGEDARPAAERFNALFGEAPAMTRREAEPRRERRAMAWIEYRERYATHLELTHPGVHAQHVRAVLQRFTNVCQLLHARLDQVTNMHLADYVAKRMTDTFRGRPVGARTINNELQILNTCFLQASQPGDGRARKRLGLIARAPFHELLAEEDLAPTKLSEDRIAACLAAVKHATAPIYAGCSPASFWTCALLVARITLLRRGALLKIPRPDDDTLHGARVLFLPAKLNKVRSDEWISLGSQAAVIELIASLPSRPGEPLLPWRRRDGRPMSLDAFNRHMAAFQERAGIAPADRVRLKDFRSTSATEVGDEFNETIAKRKLKHGPTTDTFRVNYQSRLPTEPEVAATDFLVAKFAAEMQAARERPATPVLKVVEG